MRPVRFLPNPITKRQMGHRRAPGARGASLLAGRVSPAWALAGAALLLVTGFVIFGRPGSDDVLASHGATQGQVDFVSIDMDPNNTGRNGGAENGTAQCGDDGSGNPSTGDTIDQDLDGVADDGCPNSGIPYITTVGSIEPCIQKNAGTTAAFNYFVDITVDEVHPSDDLEGWQVDFLFNFSPNLVQVVAINDSGPLTFMGADLNPITSFSSAPGVDSAADPDLIAEGIDGSITVAAVDFGDVSNQQGEGILAKVTLRNVAVGTSPLTLTNVKLNPAGPSNNLPVITIQNAAASAPGSGTPTPAPFPCSTPLPTLGPSPTATLRKVTLARIPSPCWLLTSPKSTAAIVMEPSTPSAIRSASAGLSKLGAELKLVGATKSAPMKVRGPESLMAMTWTKLGLKLNRRSACQPSRSSLGCTSSTVMSTK